MSKRKGFVHVHMNLAASYKLQLRVYDFVYSAGHLAHASLTTSAVLNVDSFPGLADPPVVKKDFLCAVATECSLTSAGT